MRERAQAVLKKRQLAYLDVFKPDSLAVRAVLIDLARFCRAHDSTFHQSHSCSDRLDGRREVWLRIQTHLRLTDDALWELYGNHALPSEHEPKE